MGSYAMKKLLPSTAQGLKSSFGSEAQNVDLQGSLHLQVPQLLSTFQSLSLETKSTTSYHRLSHICQDDFQSIPVALY